MRNASHCDTPFSRPPYHCTPAPTSMSASEDTVPRLATPDLGHPFAMNTYYFEPAEGDDSESVLLAIPNRLLRSRVRQARLLPTLQKKNAGILPSSPPRLRRVRAFSPPGGEAPAFSPIFCIEVREEELREDAVAKTRAILHDIEKVEQFARRLSLSSPDSSDTFSDCDTLSFNGSDGPPSPYTLHRKGAIEDLRSQYSSSESVADSRKCISASTISDAIAAPSVWSSTADDSSATSKDTLVWRDVYCICGRSHHPAHGTMVTCTICDMSNHLRCVGMGHLEATAFDEDTFVCPACEGKAWREIAEEEEEAGLAFL